MAHVTLQGVSKSYGDRATVHAVDLAIADKEFMVLVGPSGCGKSTTLRMIAGLETITSGRLIIDGRDVTDAPPQKRDIAMVFQSYALYPHMTAYMNMAFGLMKTSNLSKPEIDARVRQAAEILHIEPLLQRKPNELSGGERQRVAIGRALVRKPKVYLFDEPLSNLDAKLRNRMRGELKRLHSELGITVIYVTHDQIEAMTLGTRVAMMSKGHLQQVGAPMDIYMKPANTFVATFIGSPEMSLIPCSAAGSAIHHRAFTGVLRCPMAPCRRICCWASGPRRSSCIGAAWAAWPGARSSGPSSSGPRRSARSSSMATASRPAPRSPRRLRPDPTSPSPSI